MMTLIDNGTLDTVFECSECGEEIRTNPEPSEDEGEEWGRVERGREIAQATHDCTAK